MRTAILFAIWIAAAVLCIFSAVRPPTTLGLGTGPTRTSWSAARTNIVMPETPQDPLAVLSDPGTPREVLPIGSRHEIVHLDGSLHTYEVVGDGTHLKFIKAYDRNGQPIPGDRMPADSRDTRTSLMPPTPVKQRSKPTETVDLGALLQEQLLILLTAGVLTIATRRPSSRTGE